MRLGIMQPYFFPYIGYYDVINRSERWVVFDIVKYVPKSWMNRNRILHPTQGWQYVTVPVDRHSEGSTIKDVSIVDKQEAHRRILGQLEHYRSGRAPYFRAVRNLVDRCFTETETSKLRDLNVRSLALVCDYLGIGFRPLIASQIALALPPILHPGQWALEISSALGASTYVNPPGGRELFRPEEFESRGIGLEITPTHDFRYDCGSYGYVERLSVLDVLMWNSPGRVKAYLDDQIPWTNADNR